MVTTRRTCTSLESIGCSGLAEWPHLSCSLNSCLQKARYPPFDCSSAGLFWQTLTPRVSWGRVLAFGKRFFILLVRMKPKKIQKFDVAVIGAGAAGSTAALELCSMGYKVALIDAGSADGILKRSTKSWAKKLSQDYRIQRKSEAFNSKNEVHFVRDSQNPYAFSEQNPFYWIRTRSLGGRMNLWTGECYRMSDLDFKAGSRDGMGVDWPLEEKDLRPYYEKAENILRIRGHKNGIETAPDSCVLDAPDFDGNEKFVHDTLQERGIPVILDRLATSEAGGPPNMHAQIHYAQKSGNLTYFPGVVATCLKRGKSGLIESVHGLTSRRKTTVAVKARAFFLCASTIESTRLVMGSGLKVRSQNILGRYLHDHIGGPKGIFVQGYFPVRDPDIAKPERILYIPRYQNLGSESVYPFKRGFSTRVCLKRINPFLMGFALTSFGEAPPYKQNGIELRDIRDHWGSPTVRIKMKLYHNEHRMFECMKWELMKTAEALTASGGKIIHTYFNRRTSGLCNHEVGTLRMGHDPEQSFLDSYCRSHDIENLYVTDGSSFPSLGTANPTLTLMALTYRACNDVAKRI